MAYTPNMSKLDIQELDKERGKRTSFPETNNQPEEKQPWQEETPVNKTTEAVMKSPNEQAIDILKSLKVKEEETAKAVSTRTLPVLRPTVPYDPAGVYNSATTPVTRNFSRIVDPEGVAPLYGETLRQVDATHTVPKYDVTKSCPIHGITYKALNGCHPCSIAKSTLCKNCGGDLVKMQGGVVGCAKGC